MNPDILPIMQNCLARGFKLLVLTNAMRPMMRPRIQAGLLDLKKQFAEQLTLRVSIDHFDPALHEQERGPGSWSAMIRVCSGYSETALPSISPDAGAGATVKPKCDRAMLGYSTR